jgi:hypothetical protein
MRKTGQKRLDTLRKRHDTPASNWGEFYTRAVREHTHIPLVTARDYIDTFRGVAEAACSLTQDLILECQSLYDLAQDDPKADLRNEIIARLGPLLTEEDSD